MKRFFSTIYIVLFLFFARLSVVVAQTLLPQDENICGACLTKGDCHLKDIPCYIKFIAEYVVGIVGTLSVVMIMVGGYQWIMGGVSEDQKSKAKKTIFYAVIGLIITLLSWLIVNYIQVTISTT